MAFQVMQVIGDLSFGQGAYDQARPQYEEIVRISVEQGRREEWAVQQLAALQPGGVSPEEMREYSALLKNYMAFVPRRDGYAVVEQAAAFLRAFPGSRLAVNVGFMQKAAREQADSWLNRGIQRIEAMAAERGPGEGEAVTDGTEAGTDATHQAGDAPAQSTDAQAGLPVPDAGLTQEELQARYDQGAAALTAKEYDKAIESFNALLTTPFADRARTSIDEAARLGAQEDRQKAADLFVRANSTSDQENKKNLLLSSRQLLQGILVKYPQAGLADKVQRNLSGVDRALKAIDPSL
jgi:tetratricopeptide (TPR) repeat protein